MRDETSMSRRHLLRLALTGGGLAMSGGVHSLFAQTPFTPRPIAPPPGYMEAAEKALIEPFKGITTDGTVMPGLFSLQQTGIPTTPITDAAAAFLEALTPEQQAKTLFPVESDEWRNWSNIHRYPRQGISLAEMHSTQREKALALLRAGLSARGSTTAQDIMRLNETVAELTGRRAEYGDSLYWFTIMGTPSAHEPWGWQLDGHHLVINYFIRGDQIVMTPTFMGSEPVRADSGKYAGTRVFQVEEANGLALIRALTAEQQERAIVSKDLPRDIFTAAFRDNFEMSYAGIRYDALSSPQQAIVLELLQTYVGNIRPGHAEVRMAEVTQHLRDTYFAWMGGIDEDSVFYYRVHSPVILIEFDHQRGIAFDNDAPSRHHIHTVVRTPNGNDYGRDLLRQHHARFDHTHATHRH